MPNDHHKRIVSSFLEANPGAKTHGFRKALVAAVSATEQEPAEDIDAEFGERGRGQFPVPDAYFIDHESRLVICLEASCWSRWCDTKSAMYSDLWFTLDCQMWDLAVIEIDQWGGTLQRSLMSEWYARQYARQPCAPTIAGVTFHRAQP